MPLGTDTDVQNVVGGPDAFLRLFDRDGDGAPDVAILAAAEQYADAMIYAKLGASFLGVSFTVPGPVPIVIVVLWARLAVSFAAEAYPGSSDPRAPGPYAGMKASALRDLDALADNNRLQLPTGAPAPFDAGATFVSAPTPIWSQAAVTPSCDPDTGVNGPGTYSGF